MACFADALYQVLTSKKLTIFLTNQSCLSNSISNCAVIRRAAKKKNCGGNV